VNEVPPTVVPRKRAAAKAAPAPTGTASPAAGMPGAARPTEPADATVRAAESITAGAAAPLVVEMTGAASSPEPADVAGSTTNETAVTVPAKLAKAGASAKIAAVKTSAPVKRAAKATRTPAETSLTAEAEAPEPGTGTAARTGRKRAATKAALPVVDTTGSTPARTIPPEPRTGEPETTAESAVVESTLVPLIETAADGRTREDLPSDADLTRAVRARPQLAPAALAVAAVSRFGESAREHAEWLRRTYPGVAPQRLAQDAVRTANRRTRYAVGSALLGGPLGFAASISTMTWAHARLVIDIAAIFGRDPLVAARAVDVLVLLDAYPDPLAARKAVAELAGDLAEADVAEATTPGQIIVSTTAQLLTRVASRILPGTAVLAAAIRGTSETERLTARAIRYFRA
jgi:hypothetical protein